MRFSMILTVLGLAACVSCKSRESEQIREFQAQIALKNRKLLLLEEEIHKQRVLIQDVGRKEHDYSYSNGLELSARELRIGELQKQLDIACTQLVKGEAKAREALEIQRKAFNDRVEGLQERVTQLEKELAERK